MQTQIWHHLVAGLCFLTGLSLPLQMFGATTNLVPVADTSLLEPFPTNNFGGATVLLAGTGENLKRHRALLQFDPASQLPARSRILNASLVLEVTKVPANGFAARDFELHRVLLPWGEGNKISPTNCTSCFGEGALATTNEATWFDRFALTPNPWTAPGGDATNDYASAISSSQTIYLEDPYTFGPTPQMVADVQLWLDHPETNFGWILLTVDESVAFTARRFASRENANPDKVPQLVIDYVVQPRIDRVERNGNQTQLFFTAEAGQTYDVQYCDTLALTNNWITFTNISAPPETTNLVVGDIVALGQRFYRLRTQ